MSPFVVMAVVARSACLSMAFIGPVHEWPQSWPSKFHAYTDQTQLVQMATGYQGDWYKISFNSREEFEELVPAMLAILDHGSQVTIRSVGDPDAWKSSSSDSWDNARLPAVGIKAPRHSGILGNPPMKDQNGHRFSSARMRIHSRVQYHLPVTEEEQAIETSEPIPSGDLSFDFDAMKEPDGRWLRVGPPWPKEILDADGNLPELVHNEGFDKELHWVAGRGDGFQYQCRTDIEILADWTTIDPDEIVWPDYVKVIDLRPGPWAAPVRLRRDL